MIDIRHIPTLISRRAMIVTASAQALFGFGAIGRAFAQKEPNNADSEFAGSMLAALGEPAEAVARAHGLTVKSITVALSNEFRPHALSPRAECKATVEQRPTGPVIVISCP